MDKQIEEMAQDIACGCVDLVESSCGDMPCYVCIARKLKDKNYRKITELQKNTVLTADDIAELLTIVARDTRKETAEKFAERLKDYYNWGFPFVLTIQDKQKLFVYIDEIAKEITEGKK